ncbi:MAG: peptide chain release factor 2 [Candidatus Omnitrophica bacterium]|nr:peptide chain release factor 2 [Candidatus Omnitrophota bacterium]
MIAELKETINILEEKFRNLRGYFEVGKKCEHIASLEDESSKDGFWNDETRSKELFKKLKALKSDIEPFIKLESEFKDLKDVISIAGPEDASSLEHFKNDLAGIIKRLDALEFRTLLDDEADRSNAILSVNAGAGGTESCDWAAMLLRMYIKWAESKGFKIDIIDQLSGEEAGIKNATMLIKGEYAYGFMKSETGVHRLVRISPFDSNKRRHTSFASIDIIPEVSDDIQLDIKEADLKIDTYRAGGKGGQHVNKTDSAVRITHIPTGIVVQCQNERSQLKNRSTAMKILKAKLYERERMKKMKEQESAYDSKKEIAWGSQIRSYVLHPYSMVKDHRTDFETGKAQAVLEGEIDDFIEAYLKWAKEQRTGK